MSSYLNRGQPFQADLSFHCKQRLEEQGTPELAEEIARDTTRLAALLTSDAAPWREGLQDWIHTEQFQTGSPYHEELNQLFGKLRQGRIDVDAILEVAYGDNKSREGFFEHVLFHGKYWAAPFFREIIEHSQDHDLLAVSLGTDQRGRECVLTYQPVLKELLQHPGPMTEIYLSHPKLDVDVQIGAHERSFLATCLNVCIGWRSSANYTPQIAERYAKLLLDRGAIPPHECWIKDSYWGEQLAFTRPYVAAWEAEWQAFESGALSGAAMTTAQLGHFYSLGHLSEAMQPERWAGHEAHGLMLYDDLPKWVQTDYPCREERHALTVAIKPQPVVEAWSATMQHKVAPPDIGRV